jgi:hypothetical protein
MKEFDPIERDEELKKLLHEWKVAQPTPPRFQEHVWRRIERTETDRASSPFRQGMIAHWIGVLLPRPAMATVYVTVLLAVGATIGWTQGHSETARVKDELAQRYIRTLDPYLAPRE